MSRKTGGTRSRHRRWPAVGRGLPRQFRNRRKGRSNSPSGPSKAAAAISATTRPASRPARPASTSRISSARSRPATSRARRRHPRAEHLRRRLRARLPDRGAVRAACVRNMPRTSRSRSAFAAPCHRLAVRARHPALRPRAAHGKARRGGRRRSRQVSPARIASLCWAMT